jgi:predicted DNA-binding transcriptional regulator AlpA
MVGRIPWSRVHITRLEAARKFPLHVDLGENTVAWFEDEIDDLLEMKAAERDAKARALANLEDGPMTDTAAAEREQQAMQAPREDLETRAARAVKAGDAAAKSSKHVKPPFVRPRMVAR